MDFNLRKTAFAEALSTNVSFLGHYGDRITLAEDAVSGTYQSPVYDWGMPAGLQELVASADLNGGQAFVSIETSDDGFTTVATGIRAPLRSGVNSYPLAGVRGRTVRVRFEMVRPTPTAASPLIDGFRVTGKAAQAED